MKCHYEILEVSRDADDDTLKKSYRKLALKWHPDKNPDNVDECTQYFALLQQAYEVLSDPHERAFYDKHRESILKGGFDGDYKDESLDLFQFFTSSCYRGYEGDKGFFTIYRNVFESLSNEDYDYIDDPSVRFPSFGDANSDYDTVTGPFYGFWASFCTARSFAWLDKYDLRDADNRFQARAIEAENKKHRDVGRAERNDQIRELVAFVRKRDPRIKAYKEVLELRRIEATKKQEEQRRKQIQKNMELAATYKEDEETRDRHLKHLEEIMAEHDSDTCDEFDVESDQVPFCLVCDKAFKSKNALNNHENSKQHRKQLQELRKHMKEEDSFLFDKAKDEPENAEQENKGGKKSKRRNRKKKGWDEDSDEDVKETEAAEETSLTQQVQDLNIANEENTIANDPALENNLFLTMEEPKKEPAGDKKKKRRAEKKPNGVIDVESIVAPEPSITADPKTGKCDKCGEFFESRSRLFAHLKETGHASTKYNEPTVPVKNKKGKRK